MAEPGVVNPNRVFVGNLAPETSEDALRAWASGIGAVESVEVVASRAGRTRGHGYVSFADAATAARAVESFNGSKIGDREVQVEAARPPRVREERAPREATGAPPNRLFVGTLPFETDEAGLAGLFAGVAGVTGTEINRRANGDSKGWGYVTFGSTEQAQAAIAAVGPLELEGRALRIESEAGPRKRTRGRGGGAGGAGGEGGEGGAAGGRNRRRRAPREDDDAEYTYEGDPKRVFVGNLPWSTDDASLAAAFTGAVSAEVARSRDGSRSRGFGYVTFRDEASATASTTATITLEGRELRVELERRRVRVEA
eukprot:CAMPEP_0203810350 /NCGR_PEP_ID=MMETSP0115-20131106/2889_1 /ASSEMBLY_ACC=CAM_ASM_000227 /TAXON_ID=33651 /ORGANISM="Bicosoecid sp, Strain ms1" /LENGTH=311 /DNA_ID=CAMNT_0050719141 /DNA_START=77 /DNA_END=1012 /DNA_ORIENTATION=-